MPLAPAVTFPMFLGCLVSAGNLGVSAPKLAMGLAQGLSQYASGPLVVTSNDVGTAGVGTGQGLGMQLPPPAVIGAMVASLNSSGIVGIASVPTGVGIAQGFVLALAQARISTISAGVGAGTGVARLVPNGASVGIFIRAFQSAGMVGVQSVTMATAVARGFDIAAVSAVGQLIIAGPPSPSPASGVGIGKLS